MRYLVICLLFVLSITEASSQFFVQKLQQINIKGAEEAYVVIDTGDTIRGNISQVSYNNDLIKRLNFRSNGDKISVDVDDIKVFALIPLEDSGFDDTALGPIISGVKNKEFLEVLPQDGWLFYERIRVPGRQERYQLAQLLNPGFDTKIKVYAHPEAENDGFTKVSGLTVGGLRDNIHYISVAGDAVFEFKNSQYRKKSLEQIFNHCPDLRNKKLKWKEFAKDVFLHFQKCL